MTSVLFFFNDPATTEIYTLSLHDALPIYIDRRQLVKLIVGREVRAAASERRAAAPGEPLLSVQRSEDHTSELQSPCNLVCRLLLEKKKLGKLLLFRAHAVSDDLHESYRMA